MNRRKTSSLIDNTISKISNIGRHPSDDVRRTRRDVAFIVDSMNKHQTHLDLQRAACHALSNVSMHLNTARCVVEKGGFHSIACALRQFPDDERLCWLGTSAVWNLARSPHNRNVIGAVGTKLLLSVLLRHRDDEKVAATAIGALSNLSLDDNLKDVTAEPESLGVILPVLVQYVALKSARVMASAAGLLANLAISDAHAATLIDRNVVPVVLDLLTWKVAAGEAILVRNACVALKNLCSAAGFLDKFLGEHGAERVYGFLAEEQADLHRTLCGDVLNTHEADAIKRTTSLHLAAHHGKRDVVQKLIARHEFVDLDAEDEEGQTPLDAALIHEHADVARLLARCGAVKFHAAETLSEDLLAALEKGRHELREAREASAVAARGALVEFPEHLCDFVVGWTSHIDVLKGAGKFC